MPNWVDVLILCIIARGVYIGLHSNLFSEFFKVLGAFLATFVTLHYYNVLGGYIKDYFRKFDIMPDFVAFVLIAILIMAMFYLMKEGWQFILRIAFSKTVDLWGGFIFSLGKTYLLCGLVLLSMLVSGNEGMAKSARASLSDQFLHEVSVDVYQGIYDGVVRNMMPDEKINEMLLSQLKVPLKEPVE